MDRLAALQQSAPPELQAKLRTAARQVEGERKPVTILFTDIVGSTALAEKLDPEEWKVVVSGAHQRVSQAVYRYEGTIAQLLGDGVLAFFGAPVTHEDDALRAVLAALDIQRAMAGYERQLQGYLESFKMRIGLNTGTVVVGSVGSDLHMEYLAIGDAVNLAARLQAAAEPGKVLISESTARLVQAAFTLRPLGEISLKGKAEPVAAFEVGEGKTAPEGRRGFAELYSPLVGREAELATLHHAMQQLSAGLGQIVAITGEAGIGKNRLVDEACRLSNQEWQIAQSSACQSLRWLEGRALSYGQGLSFWTIRQLLLSDLGLSDGDPELKLRLALRRRVGILFGEQADQALPYLSSLLGVSLEEELVGRVNILDGETLKHLTMFSIAEYFTRLAEQQPTVLVFDDLHWADPSSLEALERLLPLTDRLPLMLILMTRPERAHLSWELKLKAGREYPHRYAEISLQPLSGEEQNRMVDNLLAIADMPNAARGRILERAEGNPFFLEEIVRDLIEQGAIVREGQAWRTSREILTVAIPETLRGVLLARIDRLQEEVRRTLQLASVIGKSFLYRLLEAIAEAEEQLEGHLAQLQRADLVREKARLPELEYMFKHSLTQEAAYHSLLLEQRREFHLQVGLALEDLFAGRKEEFIGLLAHHFDAAGESEKAIAYLIQAGDKARLTDEHMEAVSYYQRAAELLSESGDADRGAQVWLKLGLVYHANFQFEATYQAYESAFALERKIRRDSAQNQLENKIIRFGSIADFHCFDPGKASFASEASVIGRLFSGLARVDNELNVVPDAARSWQVQEGGRRYIYHLREDVRWTNGAPVTAYDFEWALKRNLHPSFSPMTARSLYAVVGAQAYHQGQNPDPDSLGVHALDALTLEVNLANPVAFFPFITTLHVSFPLPRGVIERYGETWWHPEHIVSNGAYRLVTFDPESGGALERNPGYHGEFSGNVSRIEWKNFSDLADRLRAYQENSIDAFYIRSGDLPADIPLEEIHGHRELRVDSILINPILPPLNDLRLRRALGLALERENVSKNSRRSPVYGGIIPPGMPGHTPDFGLRYDPDTARRLLAEAGHPQGRDIPVIKAVTLPRQVEFFSEITAMWRRELGINVEIESSPRLEPLVGGYSLTLIGWLADYPDPDTYMRQSNFIYYLNRMGWRDEEYEELVGSAVGLANRSQRMALYRQADHLLVVDRALVLPVNYSGPDVCILVKSWVKNYKVNLLGMDRINDVFIEDH